jgi:hypothetical protein
MIRRDWALFKLFNEKTFEQFLPPSLSACFCHQVGGKSVWDNCRNNNRSREALLCACSSYCIVDAIKGKWRVHATETAPGHYTTPTASVHVRTIYFVTITKDEFLFDHVRAEPH